MKHLLLCLLLGATLPAFAQYPGYARRLGTTLDPEGIHKFSRTQYGSSNNILIPLDTTLRLSSLHPITQVSPQQPGINLLDITITPLSVLAQEYQKPKINCLFENVELSKGFSVSENASHRVYFLPHKNPLALTGFTISNSVPTSAGLYRLDLLNFNPNQTVATLTQPIVGDSFSIIYASTLASPVAIAKSDIICGMAYDSLVCQPGGSISAVPGKPRPFVLIDSSLTMVSFTANAQGDYPILKAATASHNGPLVLYGYNPGNCKIANVNLGTQPGSFLFAINGWYFPNIYTLLDTFPGLTPSSDCYVAVDSESVVWLVDQFSGQVTVKDTVRTAIGPYPNWFVASYRPAHPFLWPYYKHSNAYHQMHGVTDALKVTCLQLLRNLSIAMAYTSTSQVYYDNQLLSDTGAVAMWFSDSVAQLLKWEGCGNRYTRIRAILSQENYGGICKIYAFGVYSGPTQFGRSLLWSDNTQLNGGNGMASIFEYGMDLSQNKVKGIIYDDLNGNGIQDAGELGTLKAAYAANVNGWSLTPLSYPDCSGQFEFGLDSVPCNGTISLFVPPFSVATTASVVPFSLSQPSPWPNVANISFGIQTQPNIYNTRLLFRRWKLCMRNNSWQHLTIDIQNAGSISTPSNFSYILKIDTLFDSIQTIPPPSSNSGGMYTWTLGTMAPNSQTSIDIKYFKPNLLQPDTVLYLTGAIPLLNDVDTTDNFDTLVVSGCNSYDPNYKTVSPSDTVSPKLLTDAHWLTYTIHFQNTGNAAALDVMLLDSLKNQFVDSTLEVLKSSHPVLVDKQGQNVWFRFVNINLPDSASNTEGSQGFVSFRMKPKKVVQPNGHIIKNRAYIYFDSNPAIITNDATTNYFARLGSGVAVVRKPGTLRAYPNPAKDAVSVTGISNADPNVFVYDMLGRQVLHQKATGAQTTLSLQGLAPGLYTLVSGGNHLPLVKSE